MLRVNLNCYGSYTTDNVYQWDQNHTLTLTGDNIDDISAIHFCNKKCDNARVVNVTRGSGEISAPIPNELLEMPYDVIAYVHSIDDNQAKTIEIINIPVVKRVKPDDYEFVENVDIVNFERLEKDINDFISSITIQQNTFESDFMTEYNNRVASGYFIGPDGARRLNERIDQLENDTDARLDRLEQQIIDVDALNDASGSPILLTDIAEGVLTDIAVYGKSTQDGTPTPDNPIDIVSVGNWFDGVLLQGTYSTTNGAIVASDSGAVCSKNDIACKEGYRIKVTYEGVVSEIRIHYFNKDTFVSYKSLQNVSEITDVAPANVTGFKITVIDSSIIAPHIAKKIVVTINNTYGLLVKSVGKNLLQNTAITKTVNGVTFTVNNDGSVTVNGTASALSFITLNTFTLESGDYILSGCPVGGGSTYRLYFYIGSTLCSDDGNTKAFSLTEKTRISVIISVYANQSVSNLTFYPMIRPANIDGTYEPYTESVNAIPLSEPLRGIGDSSDEVSPTKVTRRFTEVVYDGSDDEDWRLSNTYVDTIVYGINPTINAKSHQLACICSHFKYSTTNEIEHSRMTNEQIPTFNVWVNKSRANTVEDWKNWLQANPITVVYELAEPVIEEIDPFEIVTYDDVSYFTATDNAPMWIEYYSNSPIGKRLSNTNEEMKNEHDAIKATLGYMTTEKNHIKQCFFYENTTYAGLDVTVNEDNSFTLNGTTSQDINYNQLPGYLESGATYILSGCPVGGGEDSYYLQASYRTDSGIEYANDFGEGVEFTNGEAVELSLLLFIKAGTTFENVTFYPMLRYASIKDDTYEPYGLNVKHRFEKLDRKNHLIDSSRISIDPSSTGENVINKGYPDGFTRDNCIVSGVSYGYRSGGYGTEAPSRYYNDAVVVLEANNIAIHINGNGSSSFVDVKILLTKIS